METKKSPGIAVLLSLIIVGAGNMYAEKITKGILFFIGAVLGVFLTAGILSFILWIASMITAYNDAIEYNNRIIQE